MKETWRWFGPEDTVSLEQVRQAGATGVVTALDDIPTGEVWPPEAIAERKRLLESHGLEWTVVESVPVHQDIKLHRGDFERLLQNYCQTLTNLGGAGIRRVCYNFMPVVDWVRTSLDFELDNAASALKFEMADFVAYDVFMLERSGTRDCYSEELIARAASRFEAMGGVERQQLERNIIAGLPGGEGSHDRGSIREAINTFNKLGNEGLRRNLATFLEAVVPVAEAAGVVMAIHPDDPPISLFGLPRIVSTADDARWIVNTVPSPSNGLTMCAGSYGARSDNDLVAMVNELGAHIQFVHLRNIRREADHSFYESDHLDGDNDMVGLIGALLNQERYRCDSGADLHEIPMRPDHGHALGDEKGDPQVRPGYSYAGRMKGLAELRGIIHALTRLEETGAGNAAS